VDQRWDNVGVDDGLDLRGVASGHVGDGPARLLADTILSGAQQRKQSGERSAVDDNLGLDVVTGDNVADGSEGGSLDGSGGVHQQLHETAGDAGLDHGLDLVVGAIREVGNGPAGVDEHLVIEGVYELSKDGEGGLDLGQLAAVKLSQVSKYVPSASLAAGSCHGRSCSGSKWHFGACSACGCRPREPAAGARRQPAAQSRGMRGCHRRCYPGPTRPAPGHLARGC